MKGSCELVKSICFRLILRFSTSFLFTKWIAPKESLWGLSRSEFSRTQRDSALGSTLSATDRAIDIIPLVPGNLVHSPVPDAKYVKLPKIGIILGDVQHLPLNPTTCSEVTLCSSMSVNNSTRDFFIQVSYIFWCAAGF